MLHSSTPYPTCPDADPHLRGALSHDGSTNVAAHQTMTGCGQISAAVFITVLSSFVAHADVIDFESVPGQPNPIEGQLISAEFEAASGVTFVLLENDGMPADPSIGPRLAEVGGTKTAFVGPSSDPDCDGIGATTNDTVLDLARSGCWMLTDDGVHPGPRPFGLLIVYTEPVLQASGELLDVDNGPEAWRITALDSDGAPIDHPQNPFLIQFPDPGTGDGVATVFAFDLGAPIHFIELIYTGEDSFGRGLAFDNFSPASLSSDAPVDGGARLTNEFSRNTPNPLNSGTRIRFSLADWSQAKVEIYDTTGRAIRDLLSETLPAGWHGVDWDGRDDEGRSVAAGTYFYRLSVDGRLEDTGKAAVVR